MENQEQVGVVLTFARGITPEQAQKVVDALRDQDLIESSQVNTYDPAWGGPVWYIP